VPIMNEEDIEDTENMGLHRYSDEESRVNNKFMNHLQSQARHTPKTFRPHTSLFIYQINPLSLLLTTLIVYFIISSFSDKFAAPVDNTEHIMQTKDTVESLYLKVKHLADEQTTKLESSRAKLKELTKQKTRLESLFDVMKTHEETLVEDNKSLVEELTNAKAQIEKLKTKLDVQDLQIQDSQAHFQGMELKIEALKTSQIEMQQLREEISILRQANALKVSNSDAQEELAKAQQEVDDLRSQLRLYDTGQTAVGVQRKVAELERQQAVLEQKMLNSTMKTAELEREAKVSSAEVTPEPDKLGELISQESQLLKLDDKIVEHILKSAESEGEEEEEEEEEFEENDFEGENEALEEAGYEDEGNPDYEPNPEKEGSTKEEQIEEILRQFQEGNTDLEDTIRSEIEENDSIMQRVQEDLLESDVFEDEEGEEEENEERMQD